MSTERCESAKSGVRVRPPPVKDRSGVFAGERRWNVADALCRRIVARASGIGIVQSEIENIETEAKILHIYVSREQ